MKKENLVAALPMIASMLGNRLGVEVVIGQGDTAMTDGRTICLPPIPCDSDEEYLGWIRGYISHEAGHIRFTDYDILGQSSTTPLAHFIWNSLEDVRIERAMAGRYPGCSKDFSWIVRKLFVSDLTCEPPSTLIPNYILRKARSYDHSHLKESVSSTGKALECRYGNMRSELDAAMDGDLQRCTNTGDTLKLAEKLKCAKISKQHLS